MFHTLIGNEATAGDCERCIAAFNREFKADDAPKLPRPADTAGTSAGQAATDIMAIAEEREPITTRNFLPPANPGIETEVYDFLG